MVIKMGDRAPDFMLLDENMKPRSLQEFLGHKVVLAFFVGAFTATCTKEACTFRDSMARYTNLEAQIIGIRVNSPTSNKDFATKNRLPYPILSDPDLTASKRYGLEPPRHSIFILDKEGLIRYIWIAPNPAIEPDYKEIQVALTKIAD
ncbi:MAG: peroxiredoxin [Nitrososphaerota archaeon]|jgi:peroxiredoxin|uniref:peroxiredoxin n=1 Tax=Candidatus Bathycorpusculum sp. TaxID=2994959 RepID=UPI002824A5D1|nr:peroxiredoxin [Candidatus Termitimicrobium sp.]MCL2432521.1 peroxiredoxin [Candidatus Termitimicrobium sp.]MDR0492177.1 peroxiredoxin [Nitrososphaerota archaeon]